MFRIPLGIAKASALAGFLIGGAVAAREIASRPYVREFQAGAESPWGERAFAIAQRAAVEGLGFGLLGLLAGLVAVLLAGRGTEEDPRGRRVAAALLLVLAVFGVWMRMGAWFVNEAVPFLPPFELLALNMAGMAVALVGLVVYRAVVRLLPWAPKRSSLAVTAGSLLVLAAVAWIALRIVRAESGGWRQPDRQAMVAGVLAASLPVAALLARLGEAPLEALAERLGRLRVPRPLTTSLLVLLAVCAVATRPFLDLSPTDAETEYARLAPRGEPAGPNVLFVTIDTLRADHLGCYGYERPTSPNIDAIAAAGTVFQDPISAAAWTKPATGTLLTGLYPSRHGALYHGSSLNVPEGGRTLAEAFRDAGYVTAGFVSNPNVKRVFDFDRGFDEYFDSPVEDTIGLASIRDSSFGEVVMELTNFQFNWKYENDVEQMNAEVLAWLERNHDLPFFLYVHYIDPHEPYAPPKEWGERFAQDHGMPLFNERKRKVGIDLYDAEIRYCDEGLGKLVAELERRGVWDDTVFVLTSDHGEEFFEHEVLGHGFSLYQEVVRVPLIFRGPGVAVGRVVETPVQTVDLAATLLDVARIDVTRIEVTGTDVPPPGAEGGADAPGLDGDGVLRFNDGRSFAAAMVDPEWRFDGVFHVENEFGENDRDIRSFVLNSVREGPWKLVLTERNKYRPPTDPRYPGIELYNLEADPFERENLFETEPEVGKRLLERLRGHGDFLNETGFRHIKPKALTPELEAELRALGYL